MHGPGYVDRRQSRGMRGAIGCRGGVGEDRGQDVWGGKGVRGDKVGGRREGQLCRKLLEPTRARTQTSWARGIQTSWAGGTGHADLMGRGHGARRPHGHRPSCPLHAHTN